MYMQLWGVAKLMKAVVIKNTKYKMQVLKNT